MDMKERYPFIRYQYGQHLCRRNQIEGLEIISKYAQTHNSSSVLYTLAKYQYHFGKVDEYEKTLLEIIKNDSHGYKHSARIRLADLYLAQGKQDTSIQLIETMLDSKYMRNQVLLLAAKAFYITGDQTSSNKYIQIHKEAYRPLLNGFSSYLNFTGKEVSSEDVKDIQSYIKNRKEKLPGHYYYISLAHIAIGEFDQAYQYIYSSLGKHFEKDRLLFLYCLSLVSNNDFDFKKAYRKQYKPHFKKNPYRTFNDSLIHLYDFISENQATLADTTSPYESFLQYIDTDSGAVSVQKAKILFLTIALKNDNIEAAKKIFKTQSFRNIRNSNLNDYMFAIMRKYNLEPLKLIKEVQSKPDRSSFVIQQFSIVENC